MSRKYYAYTSPFRYIDDEDFRSDLSKFQEEVIIKNTDEGTILISKSGVWEDPSYLISVVQDNIDEDEEVKFSQVEIIDDQYGKTKSLVIDQFNTAALDSEIFDVGDYLEDIDIDTYFFDRNIEE